MSEELKKFEPAQPMDLAEGTIPTKEGDLSDMQKNLKDFMQETLKLIEEIKNINTDGLPEEEVKKIKEEHAELLRQNNIKAREIFDKLLGAAK